jgi:TolA-binding protein
MDSKTALVGVVLLVFGLVGGYLVGSVTIQGQLTALNVEYSNTKIENNQLRNIISDLRANVTNLKGQITILQSTIKQPQPTTPESQLQSIIAQTQVRIDSVTWGQNTQKIDSIDIRNVGSVDATIESVSIRNNVAGSVAYLTQITPTIATLSHFSVDLSQANWTPNGFNWYKGTYYVVRVTCNTGFYYEALFSTPPP